MIYVTGDTHAIREKWEAQLAPALAPGDLLLICGDFGIGFWGNRQESEELFFDRLAQQPYTVAFVDGNHENFTRLERFPVESWNGGRVHRLRENLVHLMRGECYCVEGHTLFSFGGGYSLDRYWRQEGISWWPQEMPCAEEYRNAEENLQRVNYQVDYLLTHTAPGESVYYLSTMQQFHLLGSVPQERRLNAFLDTLQQKVTYKHWYFGHLHVDADIWREQTAMMNTLRELTTGRIVSRWEPYEGQ